MPALLPASSEKGRLSSDPALLPQTRAVVLRKDLEAASGKTPIAPRKNASAETIAPSFRTPLEEISPLRTLPRKVRTSVLMGSSEEEKRGFWAFQPIPRIPSRNPAA